MTLLTKADFARRHGVSKPAVQKWEKNGWLVFSDGKVDAEASDVKLAKYRDSKDSRARRASKPGEPVSKPPSVQDDETPAQAAERILAETGAEMPLEEAKRVKENYLALLNQLEYDQKSGAVVAVAEVAKVVSEEYARVRTRLLAIPAERAPDLHRLKTVVEVQDGLQAAIVQALEELTHDAAGGT